MPTSKLNLPTISGNMSADVVRDMNALANAIDAKAGVADGIATLDASGNVVSSDGSKAVKTVNGQSPDANGNVTVEVAATADDLSITDTGNYYTATNAEGALQEIGQTLNAMRGSLVTSAQNILGS